MNLKKIIILLGSMAAIIAYFNGMLNEKNLLILLGIAGLGWVFGGC